MNVVILDARTSDAYAAGHFPGAIHADLETQLSTASVNANAAHGGRHPLPPARQWLQQLDAWDIGPETMVYVYDDQDGANAAARAWWMLRAIGHENVAVLDDWRSGRLPSSPASGPSSHATEWQWPTVSMEDVDRLRQDPAWRVLDVRATPRFLGMTEPIDPVAGHIPGAINLPYTENSGKSPDELRAMYTNFLGEIPPERLVVHCGSGVTACHTLLALERAGLHGAALYVGSWGEWCRNDNPIGKSSG